MQAIGGPFAGRRRMKTATLLLFSLSFVSLVHGVPEVAGQPSWPDTVRFLEQSTFGPTVPLIAHVQGVGFEAFLNEQLRAPLTDYPDLPFWPQARPALQCAGDCQRDNYTNYLLQRHFF